MSPFASADSLLSTNIVAFVLGLCGGLFIANLAASSFEVVPAATRASAVGVLNLIGAFISGFAALLGGMWKETVGLDGIMKYAALGCLVAGGLLIFAITVHLQPDYDRVH